jgi:hypothetical protein
VRPPSLHAVAKILVTNSEGKDSSNITKVYGCRNVIAEGPEKVPYVDLMGGEDVGKVAPAAKVQYRELIMGMVQLDKSLCQSHDATQVRKGLSRPESRGGSVSETERYTSLSSTEKHGS